MVTHHWLDPHPRVPSAAAARTGISVAQEAPPGSRRVQAWRRMCREWCGAPKAGAGAPVGMVSLMEGVMQARSDVHVSLWAQEH